MYVQPNSTIILYSGMPLDDTYSDTLFFSSLSSQTSFFMNNSYRKRTFTQNTYQRVNKGQFEAQCLADEIYDCNYMAFQNTNFGNKWFYAFVKSVEYVNNGNALVSFEIDVMQTYFFDVELKQCMIRRQHPRTDHVGKNIEPEPITLQEYTYEKWLPISQSGELDIVVMYVDTQNQAVSGHMVTSTMFSGCNLRAFRVTTAGVNNCKNFIATTASGNLQRPDSILAIFMCPHAISNASSEDPPDGTSVDATVFGTVTLNLGSDYENEILGHTIRNKKLLTYPYSFIQIMTGEGKTLPLRYEFFDGAPKVFWYASPIPPINLTVAPKNYKGNELADDPLTSESISTSVYPLCSWTYDTFRAWLAQNTVPALIQAGGAILQGAINGATGEDGFGKGAGGAAKGLVSQAANFASAAYTASIHADTSRGDTSGALPAFAAGRYKMYYYRAAQHRRALQDIDDFFDLYGYAQNYVAVPGRNERPHWTYVQTENCVAVGHCPADDLTKIKLIYDSGVRFWRDASEVGNYSLDNRPVTP